MIIPNEKAFYDTARLTLFGGNLTPIQVERIGILLSELVGTPTVTMKMGAYVLATAHHETDRFVSMEEYSSGAAYEARVSLGNRESGDGKRFKGRGYVGLTGRKNYEWASNVTGRDLIANPTLASDPHISARVIVDGMLAGAFTGVGLARFINSTKTDYVNARKVVNGLDRAEIIADIAERYEVALRVGLKVSASEASEVSRQLGSMPVSDHPFAVPARCAPRFAQSVACGSSITVLWTAIASTGWLHPALAEPEVTIAIGGILSSLASAFGLCNFFRPIPRGETAKEE